MSIDINEYKYEDEELDDIEYLEIMSLEDIIKDNPSFIALSKADIHDSLFNMFSSTKKAENITKLFYDIIDDINAKRGVLDNYDNYIFNVEAEKEKVDVDNMKDPKDAEYFNKLENRDEGQYIAAKNKYFFCIKYNTESMNVRFMPDKKIRVSLEPSHNKKFPIYYPVFPIDNVNIPIISAYYKIPKTTVNDSIYEKITDYLINSKNINLKSADYYGNSKDLIKDVRPDINHIIKYMQDGKYGIEDFDLDYNNIEAIFKKFGKSLDLINIHESDILCDYMTSVTDYEKERKNVTRPVKIKKSDILNKKLLFFDKLKSIISLLDLKESTITFLEKTKLILSEHLATISVTNVDGERIELNRLNIYNLVLHINKQEDADVQELLNNIKQVIHISNIKETVEEIDKILKTNKRLPEIIDAYEKIRAKFEYSRNHIFDYDKDGKKYLISYREIKEIKEAEYNENYEGIPMIEGMDDYINIEDQDNIAVETFDIKYVVDAIDINKYLLHNTYKTEEGFIDGLKIILPELMEISKLSNIEIDSDILCSELFKYNRSIPSRKNIYIKEFGDKNIELDKKLLNILIKVPPKHILNIGGLVNELDGDTLDIIVEANKLWLRSIKTMFINAISFWIINVQEKILEDTFPLDENYLNYNFIVNWYKYGSPFDNLKKSEEKGVLPYIINVAKEYLTNKNELSINIESLLRDTIKYVEDKYTTNLEAMRAKYELLKNKKKEMRGLIEQEKFKSMRDNKVCLKNPNLCKEQHVKSLLYMPDINYVKIHKFLHGCCLKKLDETFNDDIDLKNAKRKDLIAWKKKFAESETSRLTNKPRDLRFIPFASRDKRDAKVAEKLDYYDDYILIDDFIYNINLNDITSLWLRDMRDKNNGLLPIKSIDDIENNPKKIDMAIRNNINILAKTSKNLKSDNFIKSFNRDKIRYKSIIIAIIKILNSYSQKKQDNIELKLLIDNSIRNLRDIIMDLNKLNSVLIEDNEIDTERINKYIVSRALCSPFNPDEIVNGSLSSDLVNNSIIQELSRIIYTDILKIIELTFPTAEDNINFLNEQREKNKQNKINMLNDKTVEENLLIKELKKAGIKHKMMNDKKLETIADDEGGGGGNDDDDEGGGGRDRHEDDMRPDSKLFDDYDQMPNDIDDDEHKLKSYDEDSDDEYMLQGDMGFIYN